MKWISVVNTILFWTLLFLLLWQVYTLVFNRGIPNIRTAPAIRKRIISILKKEAAARGKKNFTIVDLGSGNGNFTREIARDIPEAHIIGLEASEHSVKWSRMMAEKWGLKNLEYKIADFFAYDLSEADAIVMYLVVYLMEDMGKKLHKDLKPGTLVISNKFRLGDKWEPVETIKVNTLYLHQRRFFVYRVK